MKVGHKKILVRRVKWSQVVGIECKLELGRTWPVQWTCQMRIAPQPTEPHLNVTSGRKNNLSHGSTSLETRAFLKGVHHYSFNSWNLTILYISKTQEAEIRKGVVLEKETRILWGNGSFKSHWVSRFSLHETCLTEHNQQHYFNKDKRVDFLLYLIRRQLQLFFNRKDPPKTTPSLLHCQRLSAAHKQQWHFPTKLCFSSPLTLADSDFD